MLDIGRIYSIKIFLPQDTRFDMLIITSLVNRMPAGHEYDRFWRREEILPTDGAIAFGIPLNAAV